MSKIKFAPNGIGSGEFTIAAPGTSTNRTINLPDTDGTLVLSDASGNVGIGGTSGGSKLEITGSSLGTTAGSQSLIQKLRVNVGNEDLCEITNTRQIAGSSWNGAGTRIQERIDATYMAYIQFNGGQTTANDGGISFGTGLQSTPTAVVERMRIDSSGNFRLGTAGSVDAGGMFVQPSAITYIALGHATGTASGNYYAAFQYGSAVIGSITQSGTTATIYGTSSDYRLKENVQPMTGALDTIALLNPVTYIWKSDGSDGQGFIAHELQEVVPDCVYGTKDEVDEEGNPKHQGVDTSFLVATLVAAIQEQQQMIQALQADIAALKGV